MNLTFFPMHFLGLAGMQRRVPDYAVQFTDFNQWATVGAVIMAIGQILFTYLIIQTIRGGKRATAQVWEGAEGLEWTLSSPPPYHSFATPPVVK
jgi:cytochrome c oxidase subunit I